MQDMGSEIGPKATRREWIGLAVLALPCLLYSMDLTVLNLAVPHLTADLAPTATQLLWIVDIYGFLLAGSLITMGTLGDRIGRRRLLLIGAACFGATSVLAAFAWSAEVLIFARGLLGIAAATLAPSTLSLIRNMFLNSRQRTFAIGVWLASFSAGGAIGPVLGGFMLSHFWWGSVFLLNVPVMLFLLAVGPLLLPEFRDPKAGKIDLLSAALSVCAVLLVIWGVKRIAADGFDQVSLLTMALGIAFGVIFIMRQMLSKDPFLDISILTSPVIATALSINVLVIFMAFGSFLFMAQYLQLVLDMEPMQAGLWTAPTGLVFIVGSLATPLLTRYCRPATLIAWSLVLAFVGFAILTQINAKDSLAVLMVGILVLCLGLAPIGTLTTDLVIGLAPPERAGAASAISETSFELGGALGIAVLGSIVTAVYRVNMAGVALPAIPDAAVARETLAGAIEVSRNIASTEAESLLAAAKAAFTAAFKVSSFICAIMAMLTAVVAEKKLWRI
jgi:DHA2 family multidrug resistance protein-like MFS transporter